MKVPLKAFIVIYPSSPYPSAEDIKIGGVASSSAHELASEEGGIVVPLMGSYDTQDVVKAIQERIDNSKTLLKYFEKDSSKNQKDIEVFQKTIQMYESQLEAFNKLELNQLTNPAHFSPEEFKKLTE